MPLELPGRCPRGLRLALIILLVSAATSSVAAPSTKTVERADPAGAPSQVAEPSFQAFLASLWPEAQKAGVSRKTFDDAFADVTPDASVLRHIAGQAEFVTPVWTYLAGAVTEKRIRRGRAEAARLGDVLARIEQRYGVDPQVLMGIWGLETNFGSHAGGTYVVRSLATLAHANYRGDYFRQELIAALLILERGHVARNEMLGSWAGAMGQPQFMPSGFLKFAVGFGGDERSDIWNDTPDALASIANYLKTFGWQAGVPWGGEALLPAGFDVSLADRRTERSIAEWAKLGVRPVREMKGELRAGLFLPAGAGGPAFFVTGNFAVIRTYNVSDAYALGVGLLGDRIFGAGPLRGTWPVHLRPLSVAESTEIQKRLVALGYPLDRIDGRIGQDTREAIRRFQLSHDMVADGYPTDTLLARLRAGR